MKKKSLVWLCTLLLASAPGASANDVSAPGLLDDLLSRLVAILSGSDAPEPAAQPSEGTEATPPPNSSSATSSEPEMGWEIPPGG